MFQDHQFIQGFDVESAFALVVSAPRYRNFIEVIDMGVNGKEAEAPIFRLGDKAGKVDPIHVLIALKGWIRPIRHIPVRLDVIAWWQMLLHDTHQGLLHQG